MTTILDRCDFVSILVPKIGPSIPDGWTLIGYSVIDERQYKLWPNQKWHDRTDLKRAGQEFAEIGIRDHYLICEIDRDDWSIYCEWDTDAVNHLNDWTEWRGDDGKPFDFSQVQGEYDEVE